MKFRRFWIFRSFYFGLLLVSAALLWVSYLYRPTLAYTLGLIVLVLIAYVTFRYLKLHRDIANFLKNVGMHMDAQGTHGMFHFSFPAVVVSANKELIWYNDLFRHSVLEEDGFGSTLSRITYRSLEDLEHHPGTIIPYHNRYYQVYSFPMGDDPRDFHMIFFSDVTEMKSNSDLYLASRPVVMMVLIDSYEEIVKNARESERTRILSQVNHLLEEKANRAKGFIQRLERDRFLIVVEKRYLDEMISNRFSLLEEVKNVQTAERIPITLSIGIGWGRPTLEEDERDARQALEMALGRGGDQVAIKSGDNFQFYGGVSGGIEKRTKVKSRIVASAMRELIEDSDNVLIMGHRFADLDAVGSSIGLARACQCMNKSVKIVLDQTKCLANALVGYYENHTEDHFFISLQEAVQQIRRNTLLFVVDTHSPHLVESTDVLKGCRNVIVVDHHRKLVESIDKTLIFYHEPYASSASEMVTELFQYFGDRCTMGRYHAEALLAGIMLDTKNFVMKTGARTFEAAAYLKRMGADTIEVKKLFAGSMESYQNKMKLVANAEVHNHCAIACSDLQCGDIRIVAPQAADELLSVVGVDASFVLFEQNQVVNINARSMGAMNVQVIMEKLGGGGHQTMAGAQIPQGDMQEIRQRLVAAIDEYFEHRK